MSVPCMMLVGSCWWWMGNQQVCVEYSQHGKCGAKSPMIEHQLIRRYAQGYRPEYRSAVKIRPGAEYVKGGAAEPMEVRP